MDNEEKNLLGECVSDRVGKQLNLEYNTIIEFNKTIRIIGALFCLAFAMYTLPAADSFVGTLLGMGALCVYIRMTMGSPLVRRLTPDSMARVQLWMATEESSASSEEEANGRPKDA